MMFSIPQSIKILEEKIYFIIARLWQKRILCLEKQNRTTISRNNTFRLIQSAAHTFFLMELSTT